MVKVRLPILLLLVLWGTAHAALMMDSINDVTCSDQTIDIRDRLPAIRSQSGAPWCATFATATLLEEQRFRHTGVNEHLSVIDLNSSRMSNMNFETGVIDRALLDAGDQPYNILYGAQQAGFVYREEQLPFMTREMNREQDRILDIFFESGQQVDLNNSGDIFYCSRGMMAYTLPQEFVEFIAEYEDLERRVTVGDRELFRYYNVPSKESYLDHQEAQVEATLQSDNESRTAIPPYNVITNRESSIAGIFRAVSSGLMANRPVQINMCHRQLMRELRSEEGDECGHHAMVAAGMRKVNGKCQIMLRNSHGTDWPGGEFEPGEGYLWVDADQIGRNLSMLEIRDEQTGEVTSQHATVTQLEDREANAPFVNRNYENGVLEHSGTYRVHIDEEGFVHRRKHGRTEIRDPSGQVIGYANYENGVNVSGMRRLEYSDGRSIYVERIPGENGELINHGIAVRYNADNTFRSRERFENGVRTECILGCELRRQPRVCRNRGVTCYYKGPVDADGKYVEGEGSFYVDQNGEEIAPYTRRRFIVPAIPRGN